MEGSSSSDQYIEKDHLPKNFFAFDRSVAFIVFLSGVSEVEKKMLNIKKLTLPFHGYNNTFFIKVSQAKSQGRNSSGPSIFGKSLSSDSISSSVCSGFRQETKKLLHVSILTVASWILRC